MFKLQVQNEAGTTLRLTQVSSYQLVACAGINPPVANIGTSPMATSDGSVFNVARMQNRNIVLTIQPCGDVETTRTALYEFFAPKSKVTLTITTNSRSVKIDGYVESFACDHNANPELVQVSIICPSPMFLALSDTTKNIAGTVNNPSDAKVGGVFEITMSASTTSLLISNDRGGQQMVITGYSLQSGDKVTINTNVGQKSITVLRGGNTTNLLPYLTLASDWLELYKGNNVISISGNDGSGTVKFREQYIGV